MTLAIAVDDTDREDRPITRLVLDRARVRGDRDALVALRDAINTALADGEGRAECEGVDDAELTVSFERVGP